MMIRPPLAIHHSATPFSSKNPFTTFGALAVFHAPLSPLFLPLLLFYGRGAPYIKMEKTERKRETSSNIFCKIFGEIFETTGDEFLFLLSLL